jgi:hypothetical protein
VRITTTLQEAEVAFESVMSEFIIAKKLLEDMTGLVFKSKELTTIDFKINFDVFIINITIYLAVYHL